MTIKGRINILIPDHVTTFSNYSSQFSLVVFEQSLEVAKPVLKILATLQLRRLVIFQISKHKN